MRIDPGVMPRRAPGWPLALTVGVHLLLAWWWLQATNVRVLPVDGAALREMFVLALRLPAPAPAPAPVPVPVPAAPRVTQPRPAPTLSTLPAPVEDANVPAPASASAPAEPPSPTPSGQDGNPSGDTSVAGRARSAVGAIDHAMRNGELAKPGAGESKWNRFAQAVEGARVDTGRTVTSESYTGPDGVTVYRFRQGGRTYCRTGGSVKPSLFGAEGGGATLFDKGGGGGSAGIVRCPTGVAFKRD